MTTHEINEMAITADKKLLETGMQAIETAMMNGVDSEVPVLRDASRHILGSGGKRLRPRILMAIYLALGGTDVEYAAPPGAAVELMHTASVVHDDINDHGIVRRGRPSVNAVWGRTFALLTGDFLFTTVYQLMGPYKDLNIILARSASALVEGETLQAYAVKNSEFTRETYARIIALKTAALFQGAAEIGARLGDGSEEQVEALSQYGYNLGLAFQIVDDILDIVGDESKLGKTAGLDIDQGRGFASAYAKNEAPEDAATTAGDMMVSIKQKLLSGDYIDQAWEQARGFISLAISYLDVLPESAAKDELIEIATLVIERDH